VSFGQNWKSSHFNHLQVSFPHWMVFNDLKGIFRLVRVRKKEEIGLFEV
jgi:hypothetical protein